MLLRPLLLLLQLLLPACEAIHAGEVPAFQWRVRTPGCAGNVSSKYGLQTVWHAASQWSEWRDFNATDAKHWLATYPDTSERASDNYFPLVTVVVIRAPSSCYADGLLSYEMGAKVGGQAFDLKAARLDLNAEPGPANVSTFGVMACNTSRSNGLAGGNASTAPWTPCWPAKVMTTREFNHRMIWNNQLGNVSALSAARSPKRLPIATTVRSVAHDVGEYADHFASLRRL
jgi:hypothetical protein